MLTLLISFVYEEIEPTRRMRHTGRREVVANGSCWTGSGLADEVLRVVFHRDEVVPAAGAVNLTVTLLPLCLIDRCKGTQSESNTLLPFRMTAKKVSKLPVVIV